LIRLGYNKLLLEVEKKIDFRNTDRLMK